MLPQESIDQFAGLYRKRFGEILSEPEARDAAESLVGIYRAVWGS